MQITPGTRVLVTGAASGFGLALTQQLVEHGARVLATDQHDERPAALDGLRNTDYRRLDVTSDVHWKDAHGWVTDNFGGLDMLFNNAGVAAGGRLELTQMDQWQWIIDINLLGVVRGCRTFVDDFKRARRGHIVNTASLAGLVHPPTMTEYTSVKAAVVAVSESLRYELAPYRVSVSAICPSFFRTNLTQSLRGSDENARQAASTLIDGARRDADQVAASSIKQIQKDRFLVLPDNEARGAYAAKRFARPAYDAVMKLVAKRMTR